jgi:hypothetical protein
MPGIGDHVRPESVITMLRNTQVDKESWEETIAECSKWPITALAPGHETVSRFGRRLVVCRDQLGRVRVHAEERMALVARPVLLVDDGRESAGEI